MARLKRTQQAQGDESIPFWRLAGAAGALLAAFQLRWGDALRLPFINDDFLFLDKTRAAPLPALWGFDQLAFHWWRPWSRETHYWAVQQLAGADPAVFHAVNAALWIAVLGAFWSLVRRGSGGNAAAWALAAAAAMAAWGLPLLWVAGVQDLWMLLASLLALHAWASDRRALAAAAYVIALLSKETSALLPAVLFVWDVCVARRSPRHALGRLAPLAAVAAAWVFLHPRLGGQLWQQVTLERVEDASRLAPPLALLRAMGVALNVDHGPSAGMDWGLALGTGLATGVALLTLLWLLRTPRSTHVPTTATPALAGVGAAWALVGFAPLLLPGLGFHAYYALFGALGVLFALAPLLGRHAGLATASVALLALLGGVRDHAPSLDWGDAPYQRRAAALLDVMRADLLRKAPRPAPHTRFFFVRVPDRVGFMAGDGPALRIWYDDPSLSGGFYSSYRRRAAGTPRGDDLFFRLDSLTGWVPVIRGPEPVAAAIAANARWERDHIVLAQAMAAGMDWQAAAAEFEKLARAFPDNASHAFDAAVSLGEAGDMPGSYRWLAEAAGRPGATEEMRAAAAAVHRP